MQKILRASIKKLKFKFKKKLKDNIGFKKKGNCSLYDTVFKFISKTDSYHLIIRAKITRTQHIVIKYHNFEMEINEFNYDKTGTVELIDTKKFLKYTEEIEFRLLLKSFIDIFTISFSKSQKKEGLDIIVKNQPKKKPSRPRVRLKTMSVEEIFNDLSIQESKGETLHRRLVVFYKKGLKCTADGCNEEGSYFALERDITSGSLHVDLYTKDGLLMTVDHDLPISKGGTDDLSNKFPMCRICNSRKSNTIPDKYIPLIESGLIDTTRKILKPLF